MESMSPAVRFKAASSLTAIVFVCVPAAACGGSAPPPAPPKQAAAPKEAPAKPKQKFQMGGQLGSLDETKVNETFATLVPRFGDCLTQGSSRVEFIGGHVKFALRIA